jgi:hypothetical protein
MKSLLCILLVCIIIYLNLILTYKFLILDTYRPGTNPCIYARDEVRIPGYFSKPKGTR